MWIYNYRGILISLDTGNRIVPMPHSYEGKMGWQISLFIGDVSTHAIAQCETEEEAKKIMDQIAEGLGAKINLKQHPE